MKIDCAGVGVRVGGNFLFVVVAVVFSFIVRDSVNTWIK